MRSPSLTKEMTPLQFANARLMLVLNLILLYTPVMIIMSHMRLNKITPMWALMIKIGLVYTQISISVCRPPDALWQRQVGTKLFRRVLIIFEALIRTQGVKVSSVHVQCADRTLCSRSL